jgi:predicted RNA-binding Zn ribbon-like protein
VPTNPSRPARQRVIAAPAPGLCLDYVNTRWWRGSAQPTESLADFDAWLQWLLQARGVDAETAACLQALRTVDAATAQRLFDDALRARERLYGLFSALVSGGPADNDASELAALLAAAPARQDLVLHRERSGWRVPMVTPSVAEVLAPVLWSAADLALATARVRLRECANPKCRWLFLDDSKSGTRRWCSMSACGNRAKVQRHFLRHSARDGERATG